MVKQFEIQQRVEANKRRHDTKKQVNASLWNWTTAEDLQTEIWADL